MKNASPVTLLREHNLQTYRVDNGYLLVSSDGDVLMSFFEKISSSSNSLRISLRKENSLPSGLTFMVANYPGATQIEPQSLGDAFLNFMAQCYKDSIDYKVKGNQYLERVRTIQKRCGIPWNICKLLATLSDDDCIVEAVHAIEDARLYCFDACNERHLSATLGTNKREKRQVLKELLGCSVYNQLRLEERGRGYLDALLSYISSQALADEYQELYGQTYGDEITLSDMSPSHFASQALADECQESCDLTDFDDVDVSWEEVFDSEEVNTYWNSLVSEWKAEYSENNP